MNQDDKSLRGRLVGSVFTLTVIALLLVMAVTSYCWFAESRSVHAGGMTVSCETPDITSVDLVIRPVTDIDETALEYTFKNDETAFSMPMYAHDPKGISSSAYKRALVLIFTISTANGGSVTANLTINDTSLDIHKEENFLSNAILIHKATLEGSVATVVNTQSFLSFDESGTPTKSDQLSFTFVDLDPGENQICLVFDYNTEYMNYIFNQRKSDLTIPNDVTYINDISFEFSVGGAS